MAGLLEMHNAAANHEPIPEPLSLLIYALFGCCKRRKDLTVRRTSSCFLDNIQCRLYSHGHHHLQWDALSLSALNSG